MLLMTAVLCSACSKFKKQIESQLEEEFSEYVEEDDMNIPTDVQEVVTAVPDVSTSSYDNVTKWVVDVTAVSTMTIDITPEEAYQIENGHYGKYAKLFKEFEDDIFVNDFDGEYYIQYHDMVVNGTKTITKPSVVKKLNEMMKSSLYQEYSQDVKIIGNTAHARWYGGNRGGGIEEEFPGDVAEYFSF